MTVISSRVKEGVLSFGSTTPKDFSCQPTNIRLTPTTSTEDPVETLCGDSVAGTGATSWALAGTAIQDFDDPAGFVMFCFDNDGVTVPFSWQPSATGGTWTGDAVVTAVEIGGDVNARITSDFTFAITGTPTFSAGASTGTATGTVSAPSAFGDAE